MESLLICLLIWNILKEFFWLKDDVGWLKRDYNFPRDSDKTAEYNEILQRISYRIGEPELPTNIAYLLVPGLSYSLAPEYFKEINNHFKKLGLDSSIAHVDGQASVVRNAEKLREIINEIYKRTKKPVLLLGHSKGGLDADAALRLYESDLKGKVIGVVFAQSPYGGSPVAPFVCRLGPRRVRKTILKLATHLTGVLKGCPQEDILSCVEDLTYDSRKQFLRDHPNVPDVATVSFSTDASRRKLKKMTVIAELESIVGSVTICAPMALAMGVFSAFIYKKYGERTTGLWCATMPKFQGQP